MQMNQQRWRRLKDIVADALEEDSPAARTELLTRECADDLSLLREAESYLADADALSGEETDRLEECAAVTAAAVRRERIFTAGHRVGAYVIIRELGHGGMATVYLAARADGYFEKEVAIKVLKPGGGSSAELIGRFRAEREVLASLDHRTSLHSSMPARLKKACPILSWSMSRAPQSPPMFGKGIYPSGSGLPYS